ncbi:hypothetical protein [uncultured Microscilla sp.]|uniref:hypothetical protein n=1 Tax=uncultured Microscilla sp. TaxID=432653 RepID=UPI00260743BA|nr:hypothetical protein [uncultured Microscilla sp.]
MQIHTIYSDQYMDTYYNDDLQLIEIYWKDTTENMTEAEYRMLLLDTLDNLEKGIEENSWKCSKILADNRSFLFTMSPRLQEWQAKYVFAKLLGLGLQKSAIIMSQEFISQFSIEQTLEENTNINENNRYFDNIQEAKDWLSLEKVA